MSPKHCIAATLLATLAGSVGAGPIRSVGPIVFADADTLVVADWRASEIHALHLAPAAGLARPFNLKDVAGPIAKLLKVRPTQVRFEDLAFRPGTSLAYVAVSLDRGRGVPTPALVTVDAQGRAAVVDLARTRRESAPIHNAPVPSKRLWRDVPEATYTVTDLVVHAGKLYVAGLSDASFASTLRIYDLPLTGVASAASVEMYHAVHNQIETRAPIRKMAVVMLDGEPTLVAAYTCTPLVTIPLRDLKDGTHLRGKTIAELGWGNTPVDMVAFDAGQGPMLLLANSHKSADLMSVAEIAKAAAAPGLSQPINWPADTLRGLSSIPVPLAGLAQLAEQDKEFLGALRRNEATGAMELVSIRKGAFLRLSDFVNEYDFADYAYPPNDPWRQTHRVLRIDEGFADLATRTGP